jgi:hypothetical protein
MIQLVKIRNSEKGNQSYEKENVKGFGELVIPTTVQYQWAECKFLRTRKYVP